MKKGLTAAIFIVFAAALAAAEAPELKKKLPTEWQRMERMSGEEARSAGMVQAGRKLYEFIEQENRRRWHPVTEDGGAEGFMDASVFYRETVGGREFYWQVAYPSVEVQLPERGAVIGLYCREKGRIVFLGGILSDLCVRVEPVGGPTIYQWRADTIQIVRDGAEAKGFILYSNLTGFNADLTLRAVVKGAGAGYGEATYFLFDSCFEGDGDLWPNRDGGITITCTDFLWDEEYPLHYALQNAFDGDPATSYVENTQDDLMKINFDGFEKYGVSGLIVINGYASSEYLYFSNNRLANFQYNSDGSFFNKIEFADGVLAYQKFENCFPNTPSYIAAAVERVYKGSKYADTCLAEINLICRDGTFVFGEIDE